MTEFRALVERNQRYEIQNYDPEKGLKAIAVALSAEDYFTKARDPDRLFEAVKEKLIQQANYVVWRDSVVVPSQDNGGPGRAKKGVAVPQPVLPDADPGKFIAHRWRKRFCGKDADGKTAIDPTKMGYELEEADQRCLKICENTGNYAKATFTGEFELYTPLEYIEAARRAMGSIDLDPATSQAAQQTVGATNHYTAADSGLDKDKPWSGNVWLNPPYSKKLLPEFVEKMTTEVSSGHTKSAIMLVNNCRIPNGLRKLSQCAALFASQMAE